MGSQCTEVSQSKGSIVSHKHVNFKVIASAYDLIGHRRISQVERKLDGLLNRIASEKSPNQCPEIDISSPIDEGDLQDDGPTDTTTTVARSNQSSVEPHGEADDPLQKLAGLAKIHEIDIATTDPSAYARITKTTQNPALDDALIKGYLEDSQAEVLLEHYRLISSSFPFVPIKLGMTGQNLRATKPMLLLAIMTIASWKDRDFQSRLGRKFREELSDRAIIRPRKDVTLVQSVLVYLAWNYLTLDHSLHDVSTTLQLCIGMLIDLRLDPRALPQITPRRRKVPEPVKGKEEEQRTLLGCYFISSQISNGFRYSNSLRHSNYLMDCAQHLAKGEEFASDKMLPQLISLRAIEDKMFDGRYSGEVHFSSFSDPQLETQLESWELKISDWHKSAQFVSLPKVFWLSYYAVKMELYLESLPRALEPDDQFQTEIVVPIATLLHAFASCLEAAKAYLDTLLAMSIEDLCLLSFSEWSRVPRVVMTVIMLATMAKDRVPGWDVKAAQDRVRLDLYLESLCFRMQNLTTYNPPRQPRPDFWMAMRMVSQSVRDGYKKKLESVNGAHAGSNFPHVCPHLGPRTPRTTSVRSHSATNGLAQPDTGLSTASIGSVFDDAAGGIADSAYLGSPTSSTWNSSFPRTVPTTSNVTKLDGDSSFFDLDLDFWPGICGPFGSTGFDMNL